MKRVLKIMVPILMVFVILFSIVWYLFIYDTQFTLDFLINQARRLESKGNLSTAAWFYDMAYEYSDHDGAVAIELAQHFKDAGNYTKAEYTLSNAIADGGNVEVYIALCKTYVEQNKLMDAVAMLDNVTNSAVKTQLDLLRPVSPTVDTLPGSYNEYITIDLSASDGTLYCSTDGSYPSTADTPYSGPIQLPLGSTSVQALCIGSNGLVSPLAVFDYELSDIVEDTFLTDPVLEAWVRDQLSLPADHTLTTEDLWNFDIMIVPEGVTTLEDLSKFTRLTQLSISSSAFDDFTPLSTLSMLQVLTINGSLLSSEDLTAIAQLPSLTELTMIDCGLSSISELAAATNLTYLNLGTNMIGNLSALSHMPNLTHLLLDSNALTTDSLIDLSCLANLKELVLSHNSIESIGPLSDCTGLYILDLSSNKLDDTPDPVTGIAPTPLAGLEQLSELRVLSLSSNKLSDVSVLAQLPHMMDLSISRNQITDITCLSPLSELCELDFSGNLVVELPRFAENTPLVSINGSQNQITSLDALRGLKQLAQVRMDDNTGIRSVEPLAECTALSYVSLFRTSVEDVSCLDELDIYIAYSKAES